MTLLVQANRKTILGGKLGAIFNITACQINYYHIIGYPLY